MQESRGSQLSWRFVYGKMTAIVLCLAHRRRSLGICWPGLAFDIVFGHAPGYSSITNSRMCISMGFVTTRCQNSGQNTLRHILRKHAVQGKPRIMVQGKQLNQVVVTLCLSPCIIKNQGSWDADHPSSSSQKHAIGKLVGETCSIITYIITRWYNANNTRLVRFNWSTCFPSTPQECLCKKKSFLLAKTEYCSKRKCLTKCRPTDSPLHEPWEMQFLWTVSLHYDYWYFLIAYRLIDLGQSLV